jgi:predicted enzyme related to lactoylglutathione lyase
MTKGDNTMAGEPSFIEIGVPSGSRARDFYQQLFGWTSRPMGKDNFAMESPTVGVGVHAGDPDACMVVYFAVSDIDAAVARLRELGGQADEPGPETEGFGRFVECRDPQNVRFGLRQAPPK